MASCFRLDVDVTHSLALAENFCLLDGGVPSRTSWLLIDALLRRLESVRDENFEIHSPHQCAAPAAIAHVPAFTNGAVGSRIPDNATWRKALKNDPVTALLLDIVNNPALGQLQEHVKPLPHVYRQPARQGHFSTKEGILYMKEIFQNDERYVSLRIVPASLVNIIFVAFHANPIGGHFNDYRTFHRIRQRYFWPEMFLYIRRMCRACPGCRMSNLTRRRTADLVYSFPIDAPMRVLMVDIYAAGAEFNFEGTKHYLIAACGMISFVITEDAAEENSHAFAIALMKIGCVLSFPAQ